MTHNDEADTLLIVYQRGFADGKRSAQRKPLTDEQILDLIKNCPKEDPEVVGWIARQRLIWCRAVEAAHGIKDET